MANNILRLNKLFSLPLLTKWSSSSKSNCVKYSKGPKKYLIDTADNKNKQESIDKEINNSNKNEQSIQIKAKNLPNHSQINAKYANQNIIKIMDSSKTSMAFREGNIDDGFEFLQEFIQAGRIPNSDIFEAYWSYCHQTNNLRQNVMRMLQFIEKNNFLLSRESTNGLILLLEQRDIAIKEVKTSTRYAYLYLGFKKKLSIRNFVITCRVCPNCSKPLMQSELTIAEYNQLKKTVEQNIMKNHLNSPSVELNYLKQTILKKRSKFDIVIDGLNVAYCVRSSKTSVIDQAKMVDY